MLTAEKQKQKQIKYNMEYNSARYFALQNKASSGASTIKHSKKTQQMLMWYANNVIFYLLSQKKKKHRKTYCEI